VGEEEGETAGRGTAAVIVVGWRASSARGGRVESRGVAWRAAAPC